MILFSDFDILYKLHNVLTIYQTSLSDKIAKSIVMSKLSNISNTNSNLTNENIDNNN